MPKTKISSKIYRIWLFWVGVIATIAYRIIVILNYYSDIWVEIAWYIGTLGFIWYFAHRYRVENKRDKLVEDLELAKKVENGQTLNQKDKNALVYILRGIKTSQAKWNYIAIFFFSVVALIYATIVNIIKLLS